MDTGNKKSATTLAGGGDESAEDSFDWKAELPPVARSKVVDTIVETIGKQLPDQKAAEQLRKTAVQFEERVYSVSKTKSDYLRKISLKISNVQKVQKSNHSVSSHTSSVSNSGQNSDVRRLLGILPNAERTSIGQGFSSDAFSNSLEQMQRRPSVVSQLQNLRNMQLQPHQQSQIQQQQNLLLSTQVQFPQKCVMQTGLHQSASSMLQQEQLQQPQQVHQLQSSLSQKPQLLSQQSLTGQLSSIANVLQNQLTGPENSSEDFQNHQQQQILLGRTNNQSSLQQKWPAQQNISSINQQLDPCSNISGLQWQQYQQQLLGSQSGNSDLQTSRHSVYMLQQSENPGQQQTPTSLHLLPSSKLPLLSHTQSQPSQDMILQQKPSHMQQSMQQRNQRAGSFLEQPNVIDKQSQLYQSRRLQPDTSTSSIDSAAQSVQANEAIQEQVYQKIKTLKDMYLHELNDLHQRISTKALQQPQGLDQMNRWRLLKHMLERWIGFIQMSKSDITLGDKDKLAVCEKQILSLLRHRRRENPTQMMHQTQQPQSKMTPVQSDGSQTNSELQELQLQSSMPEVQQITANLQPSNTKKLLENSMPTAATEQVMISPVQQNFSSGQGNAMNSSRQVAIGSLQQDSEPANPNNLSSQSGVNVQQSSIDLLQHHKQQDQQLLQTQQLDKEIQQYRMQQQLMNKQQLTVQMKTQKMSHRQHSSPEVYQQNLPTKAGTPKSAALPIALPSPPTPRGPSPMPGDGNKNVPALPMHLNAENHGSPVMSKVAANTRSHASGSPRKATSTENFTNHDDTHGNASLAESGQLTEQPIQRLIRAVRSVSPETLRANVAKMASVINMSDRIAGSAPGNGSEAAVGEELVPMTDTYFHATHNLMEDQIPEKRKMRRFFSISSSNIASSGSCIGDPFKQLSSPTPSAKRPRIMDKNSLLEEIKHINQRFIDTSFSVIDEDNDAAKNNEGIIIKCSYNAIALSPELKSRYASHLSQIQPLRLFVPLDYPNTPPQFLDKFSVEVSDDCEDFSSKSKFARSIRSLGKSMTLLEIAKTWDSFTRGVIIEYAQKSGGGTFSSKYGTWEEYC